MVPWWAVFVLCSVCMLIGFMFASMFAAKGRDE